MNSLEIFRSYVAQDAETYTFNKYSKKLLSLLNDSFELKNDKDMLFIKNSQNT